MVSALDAHSAPDSSRHPSSDADDGLFDGREMIMVHDVLRREFGLLPDVVASITPEEQGSDRAGAIAWHIDWLVKFLHHHHRTEDHYIWPLLAQRCDQEKLTAQMESEHEEIAACLNTVVKALEVWDVSARSRHVMCSNMRCGSSFAIECASQRRGAARRPVDGTLHRCR
jgi:hypothetical protein